MRSWGQYVSIVTAYAGAVSLLYLWGYWGRLGINFLEFASLTDLLRLSIIPLLLVASSLVVGALVAEGLTGRMDKVPDETFHQWAASNQRKFTAVKWFFRSFSFVAFVVGASFVVVQDQPYGWYFIGVAVATVSIRSIVVEQLLTIVSPVTLKGSYVAPIASILILLPFLAYAKGQLKADAVVEGRRNAPNFQTVLVRGGEKLPWESKIYLGTLGDFLVVRTESGSTIIERWEDVSWIELREMSTNIEEGAIPDSADGIEVESVTQ